MPVYNNVFLRNTPNGAQINPNVLATVGPLIAVEVSVPAALAEKLTRENKPIPQPKSGWALIDTGATHSCVDDNVISQLGVNPISRAKIHGSAGAHEVNVFPAHLRFPAIPNFEIDFAAALGVNIRAQQFNNQPIIALLGRDVLSRCVFVYNGPLGIYTLAF